MITLGGGADRHRFTTSDGLSYDGPDRIGSMSFLPAGCERRLFLENVSWSWASLSLGDPTLVEAVACVPAFYTATDPLIYAVMVELARMQREDGDLDEIYGIAVSSLLARHLARRYGGLPAGRLKSIGSRLSAGQLRRIDDYVEAHLASSLRVSHLADLLDLSEGHFHRAYRSTRGETPLGLINRKRIAAATRRLEASQDPILSIALDVGFTSPSGFARTFRALMGEGPAHYRRRRGS